MELLMFLGYHLIASYNATVVALQVNKEGDEDPMKPPLP
jgi:hypothetical protein